MAKDEDAVQGIKFLETEYPELIQMEISLSDHVDFFAYHDAPTDIDIWLSPEEIRKLHSRLGELIARRNNEETS